MTKQSRRIKAFQRAYFKVEYCGQILCKQGLTNRDAWIAFYRVANNDMGTTHNKLTSKQRKIAAKTYDKQREYNALFQVVSEDD